jgi:hypothetical protein
LANSSLRLADALYLMSCYATKLSDPQIMSSGSIRK